MPDPFQIRSLYPPINAVIAEVIPDDGTGAQLFYPLFSSHLMLPIKKGEVVWVIYETPPVGGSEQPGDMMGLSEKKVYDTESPSKAHGDKKSSSTVRGDAVIKRAVVTRVFSAHNQTIKPAELQGTGGGGDAPHQVGGYWISRVPGSRLSEDANFTHVDRDLDHRIIQAGATSVGETYPDGYAPQFINGVPANDNQPQQPTWGGIAAYENIILGGVGCTIEAVPPFSKRPGDMVIQGSNNTLIWLGEDRMDSVAQEDESMSRGTIDLVVGRGLSPDTGDVDNTVKQVLALRGTSGDIPWPERDKAPELSEIVANPNEGDIDLKDDRSRIYITTACQVDRLFCSPDTTGASVNITFPDTAGSVTARDIKPIGEPDVGEGDAPASLTDPDEKFAAATVVKSDHIRLVGRESIRIMVENPGGPANTAPEIILHKDGNIFINPGVNGQLFLGGGPDDQSGPDTGVPMQGFAHARTFPDALDTGGVGEMYMEAKTPGLGRHTERVLMLLTKV